MIYQERSRILAHTDLATPLPNIVQKQYIVVFNPVIHHAYPQFITLSKRQLSESTIILQNVES
jgi:hypothetical protein